MTDIKNADIPTLHAALAAKEAEAAAIEQGKLDTLHEAQRAWQTKLATQGKAMEGKLEAREIQHTEKATQAAGSGDLSTAYSEFTKYHATRRVRAHLRRNGQAAADSLGLVYHTDAELRMIQLDFTEFLTQGLREGTERGAMAEIHQLIGDSPADYEAAVTYLNNNA